MKNIKLKLLKKYSKYQENKEIKLILEDLQKEVNKLTYQEDEINVVYLGGEFLRNFSMIFSIVNTYHKKIKHLYVNFSISVVDSKITDIELFLKPEDLGELNYREGLLLQLTVPIEGISQKNVIVNNDQVHINMNSIKFE